MAQSLTKNDSPAKVLRTVRRHKRLVRRVGNAAATDIAARIDAPAAELQSKVDAARAVAEAAENAFDDWDQDDRKLDRVVKRVHRKSVDWDADHSGADTTKLLFAGRAPSEITGAPRDAEPDLVLALVERGARLPEDHPAKPLLADLSACAQASKASQRAWVDAVQRTAVADAAVEVARLSVVRVYKDNIIDIARACGDEIAEDCCPTLRRAASAADDEPASPAPPA
jgi:hypothetical protein